MKVKTVESNRIGISITAIALALAFGAVKPQTARAEECTPDGAYGETCVFDKEFEIEKKVRIQGDADTDWKDKVINVPEGKIVQFRIRAKNVGEVKTSNMRMEDILPAELEKTGGAGLTEYWSDFDVDEVKEFIIEARIKSGEFNRTDNFEKCVVNKAKLYHGDNLVGSDTATVCYGTGKITELPKAGATATEIMAIVGFASTGAGLFLRRFARA